MLTLYYVGSKTIHKGLVKCRNVRLSGRHVESQTRINEPSHVSFESMIINPPFVCLPTVAYYCDCSQKCNCYTQMSWYTEKLFTLPNPANIYPSSLVSIAITNKSSEMPYIYELSLGSIAITNKSSHLPLDKLNMLPFLTELTIDFSYWGQYPRGLEKLRCVSANKSQLSPLVFLKLFGWSSLNQVMEEIPETVQQWENIVSYRTGWPYSFEKIIKAIQKYPCMEIVECVNTDDNKFMRFNGKDRTIYMRESRLNRGIISDVLELCEQNNYKFIFYEVLHDDLPPLPTEIISSVALFRRHITEQK